jgi:hypothetical protein
LVTLAAEGQPKGLDETLPVIPFSIKAELGSVMAGFWDTWALV